MSGLEPPTPVVSRSTLARIIDHTLLRATATQLEIERLCDEALHYGFWSVCVNPLYVERAAGRLRGSGTRVCTVVSFPLGAGTTASKLFEARGAVESGAREIDVVSNIGALKSGNEWGFMEDLRQLAVYSHSAGTVLKVILECCYLTDDEKVTGARLAERAGADFVKTSTGFGPGGATAADVRLLRRTVSRKVGVKAAGGIGTLDEVQEMLGAGADRIGTSSGAKIMEEIPA
ncbi:MAG TPA: deoxyribose-phosphate aldolase [Nitrososphaerales archaeon]|nr:deoxyribose-phosphate aldolase [Nitrososphaerales archaeon]